MTREIQRIAELLEIEEKKAHELCSKVQILLEPVMPLQVLASLIVDYLERDPYAKIFPKSIARSIGRTYPGARYTDKSTISPPNSKPTPAPSAAQKPSAKLVLPSKSLQTQREAPPSKQSEPRRRSDISYEILIEAIARLLSNKNRGDKQAARKLLDKLYNGDERLQKLSNQQMLKAIRKAYQKHYFISTDTVWEAARYMLPEGRDELKQEHEISIPMGGKPDR